MHVSRFVTIMFVLFFLVGVDRRRRHRRRVLFFVGLFDSRFVLILISMPSCIFLFFLSIYTFNTIPLSLSFLQQLVDALRTKSSSIIHRCTCIINDSCPIGDNNQSATKTTTTTTTTTNDEEEKKRKREARIEMLLGTSRAYMSGIVGSVRYKDDRLARIFAAGVLTSMTIEIMEGRQEIDDMFDGSLTDIMLRVHPLKYPTIPQLFLYSNGDQLIPWRAVERATEQVQESGVFLVEKHMFDGSPHCMHYRRHEKEYQFCLKSFLKRVKEESGKRRGVAKL